MMRFFLAARTKLPMSEKQTMARRFMVWECWKIEKRDEVTFIVLIGRGW